MTSIRELISANGGVASMEDLRQRGASARAVQRAVGAGGVSRIRRGWYANNEANPQVVRAVRAGGAISCVSGCGYWGLWQPWEPSLHVGVQHGTHHIKDPETGVPYPADARAADARAADARAADARAADARAADNRVADTRNSRAANREFTPQAIELFYLTAILFSRLLLSAGLPLLPAGGRFRRAINYSHGPGTVFKLLLTPF